MAFAMLQSMQKHFNTIRISAVKDYLATRSSQAQVWQHPFAFEETLDRGFTIFFERGLSFYLMAVLAIAMAVPLFLTTGLSIHALIVDPQETFMLVFSVLLNAARIYFVKVLYDYIHDAWRKVSFNSFDEMITVKNSAFSFWHGGNQVFHIADVAGLEIRAIKMQAFAISAADDDDSEEQPCEVLMKMHDGRMVVLLPRVETIQAARCAVYQISGLTGRKLLTDIAALYRA